VEPDAGVLERIDGAQIGHALVGHQHLRLELDHVDRLDARGDGLEHAAASESDGEQIAGLGAQERGKLTQQAREPGQGQQPDRLDLGLGRPLEKSRTLIEQGTVLERPTLH
jgi:hypothetical protein